MGVGNSDIKANSVQLQLQLLTGTELGKSMVQIFGGVVIVIGTD